MDELIKHIEAFSREVDAWAEERRKQGSICPRGRCLDTLDFVRAYILFAEQWMEKNDSNTSARVLKEAQREALKIGIA